MDSSASSRVFCIGNAVSKFRAPTRKKAHNQHADEKVAATCGALDEAAAVARIALDEAAIDFKAIDAAVCGFVYADSTAGQAAIYRLGLSGIPVYNVNNNCATGSSALSVARALIASGLHHCVLALGFEELDSEGLKESYPEFDVFGRHFAALQAAGVKKSASMGMNIAAAYSAAASSHVSRYGTTMTHFATIAHKNRVHGQANPNAMLCDVLPPSVDDVLQAPALGKKSPLTFAMLAPLACGASAAILASESFLRRRQHDLEVIELVGQALCTDTSASFDVSDQSACLANVAGFEISRRAADAAYAQAGLKPADVNVVEIHDAFASNELSMYEALRLCNDGEGGDLVNTGKWINTGYGSRLFQYEHFDGGNFVVNPSGGLLSKGHPIGATGLAQCAEICWQLRGKAGKRQVGEASVGLQHNYGWASAAVVTLYRKVHLNNLNSKL